MALMPVTWLENMRRRPRVWRRGREMELGVFWGWWDLLFRLSTFYIIILSAYS